MTDLESLRERYEAFVVDRGWTRFHTPKNLAEAISIESNELLECFLWHDNLTSAELREDEELRTRVEEELADVVIYCMGLATRMDIDLLDAVESKLEDNEDRFDEETTRSINDELSRWQREDSE
jgi:NTP pyrophosphatase (non-canonical NTP hydrolase)